MKDALAKVGDYDHATHPKMGRSRFAAMWFVYRLDC